MVDEFTGHISQPGAANKTTKAISDAMTKTIATVFNANNHKVRLLHGDAESINNALRPSMGTIGIRVASSLPGDHAQRAERSTQTVQQRSRSIIDALPYHLPTECELLLQQSVGETLNNSVCKASAPSTPNELVFAFRPQRQPVPFGRCAMVSVTDDRKLKLAQDNKTSIKLIPITELAVSMGLDPGTDKNKFLLANGSVVIRRPIGPIMPRSFIPFGWIPKSTTFQLTAASHQPTDPDQPLSSNAETPQQQPTIAVLPTTNAVIQDIPPAKSTPPNSTDQPDTTTTASIDTTNQPTPTQLPAKPNQTPSPDNQPPPTTSARTFRYQARTFSLVNALQRKTGHQLRKQANATAAALRDRTHRLTNPPPPTLNNRTTERRPVPPARQQNEFTIAKSLLYLDPTKVNAAIDKEMHKVFIKYKSLKIINPSEVEKNAVHVRAQVIIREKTNKDVTARMALDGGSQPPGTYGLTHAGTSDATHRMFVLATAMADAATRGVQLITFSYDIPAAFLNKNPLTREHTGGRQLVTHMPEGLPAPYNSATAEVQGAHYGLKQSNHIHDQALIKLHTDNNFARMPSSPYTFQTKSARDPTAKLTVSMHVDDADGNTTDPELYENYKKLISDRYGEDVVFHSPSKGICGQVVKTHPDGSITLHCGPYIEKMLARIGMELVPAALCPEVEGLFSESIDPTPLSPAATSEFKTVNGELIHILTVRFDVKKQVVYLLTRNENPDQSDFLKQLHVLRYLKATQEFGPTFSNNPKDYPNGVQIHSASDCAHNVHTGGQSHGAYTLTVGGVGANTAPFLHYSAKEKGVSLSPMEGEYTTLSKTAKTLIHYRQFAADLGFVQTAPSIMLEDNNSSIKLVTTPLIPAKSRHIDLKFHHIRWAHQTKQILPQHQGSQDIVPDAATKHVGPSRFLFFRQQMFKGRPLEYSNNV
jgi:hypothetical protein